MALGDHFNSSQVIVKIWNTLLGQVMLAERLQGFKGWLDKFYGEKKSIKGY